ncbi:MAG TPA: hypothetical protein VNH11_19215 [Pirellulales bacterium]|nr:hypothetical protein [Pirellulales bacterium]
MATPDAQLEAMRQLTENWDGYGAAAPQGHVIELAREFVHLIETVQKRRAAAADSLHVSPTRTGGVLVEWEDAEVEHEVEISPDQSFAFLHLNKSTGHAETRKLSPGARAVVHPGLLHELCQLLAA